MQTTTAFYELDWARALVRAELALWSVLLEHPRLGATIRDLMQRRVADTTASMDPTGMRALDPDREVLDAVLDELSALPPDRALLRTVSELNATALRARHDLARANTGLVATTAREFDYGFVPLADLVQEGHIGLLKAVGRFDPERGVRFSTYAVWWIRHTVRRSIAEKGRLVRLPVNVVNGGYRVRKARRELAAELGRPPTLTELAAAVEMPEERVTRLDRAMAQRSLSLDGQTDDEPDRRERRLGEAVDPSAGPAEAVEERQAIARLSDLLDSLSAIEADVLRKRYGLDGREVETLSQIGDDYGLSRERIRQIQQQALTKLRRAF